MKVLIVGSVNPPAPITAQATQEQRSAHERSVKEQEARRPMFIAACRALGAALARRGHTIMVGVPDWAVLPGGATVASHVVEGVSQEAVMAGAPGHPVIFYGPPGPLPLDTTSDVKDSLEELRALPNVELKNKLTGRSAYKAKLIPNIGEVDAVMILGGADGTASIAYAAYSMGKPVIALTSLGGAAQAVADDVLLDEYGLYLQRSDLSAEDLRALESSWTPDQASKANRTAAERIVEAAERLVKAYGQASARSRRTLIFATGAMALLLLAWLGVYLGGADVATRAAEITKAAAEAAKTAAEGGKGVADAARAAADAKRTADVAWAQTAQLWFGPAAFFLLLFISALLGAGLRVLTSYQGGQAPLLTGLGVVVDMVVSLIVAFALALLYLVGSISFTGKVVALAGTEVFANISVSMSVLGLTAGYLVPLNRLREKLEQVVPAEKK